ncbi:hypothetical protein SYNPS1DRAFT_26882 [Syncephalis pseudoplumigaleata]|uniref:PX domain-containing protein n=2 Tax=Zoopagomycota TaxID=1913638 RepID=A0A4P9ZLM9_9FUNG|nr:hypothetical protein SYNPS1DRAFT_26882 [Syncephalis pseudoplumigaleata]RKP34035.1 hypothetical protein BJ085DRAFT_29343 [Dimargaris cristalligena]|eukprot:RKP27462.1 hypothetical protein SYNPS1DRAFT_26882 [Syncephalis pseudoplumigaleata]
MSNERTAARTPSPLPAFVDASDRLSVNTSGGAPSSEGQNYEFVLYSDEEDNNNDNDNVDATEEQATNSSSNAEALALESMAGLAVHATTTNNDNDGSSSAVYTSTHEALLDQQQQRLVSRELVNREITQELAYLAANPSLQYLRRLPAGAVGVRVSPSTFDPIPLLRYIYLRYVLSFPLFRDAGPSFWPRVQRFLDQLAAHGIGSSREAGEKHKRQQMMQRGNRLLTLFFYSGTKLAEAPSTALLSDPTQPTEQNEHEHEHGGADRHSLHSVDLHDEGEHPPADGPSSADEARPAASSAHPPKGVNGINLNVVTVRPVHRSGKLRDSTHAEFVLSVTFDDGAHFYVARRFHDLRRLHKQLRRAMPALELPFPPPKTQQSASQHDVYYREKDRLLMRAHLRRLIAVEPVAHSPILHAFLTDQPIDLQGEALLEAEGRAARERQLHEESVQAQEESERLTKQYQADMASLRKEVLSSGGLQRLVDTVKEVDDIDALPPYCQATFNYLCVNFATSLYVNFYSSDDSPAKLASLKRTNGMIPYRALRAVLRISNPARMAKGVTDLFLARPFGQRSVLQRIIATNIGESLRELESDIEKLEREIGDLAVCHKINKYICHHELQYTDDAEMSDDELLMRLLHDNNIAPQLHATQLERIWPTDRPSAQPHRTMLHKLRNLLTLYLKKHDKETLLSIIFEGSTSDLLKDIIAVVYGPLAEVYKAANIGDYIMDIAAFIDDLIRTVEGMDAWRMHNDGRNPLEPFRALVNRYRGNMYQFLHRLYARDRRGLFDNVLNWAETIMQFLRAGSGAIDLQAIAAEAATTDEDRAALKEDLRRLADYRTRVKERHRRKLRARLQTNVNDWSEQDIQEILDQLGLSADVEDVLGDEGDHEIDAMLTWQLQQQEQQQQMAGNGHAPTLSTRQAGAITEPPIPAPQLTILPRMVNPFVRQLRTNLDEQLAELVPHAISSSRRGSHMSYVVT